MTAYEVGYDDALYEPGPSGESLHDQLTRAEAERDTALARAREAEAQLDMPCGSCHPCENWADETWRRAGKKPPAVIDWMNLRAERDRLAATIARVEALHTRRATQIYSYHHHNEDHETEDERCDERCFEWHSICNIDGVSWPCRTVAALGEDSGDTDG